MQQQGKGSASPEASSLDFLSPHFSADEALVCSPSRVQLPCPEVQPCDNLEQYASLVRGLSRKPVPPTAADAQQPPQEGKRAALPVSSKKRIVTTIKSVISTMETPTSGPLSLVRRCREEGVRVRVVVRHCAGVRGECEGAILAFDKHLNLVLGEVTERYCPLRTVANGGLQPRSRRRRQRHKTASDHTPTGESGEQLVERNLEKLFIRGDNVVVLSPVHPLPQHLTPGIS